LVQKRGDQTAPAKAISINKNNPDRKSGFIGGVCDLAKIVPWAERSHHLGTGSRLSGNDEVGLPEEDLVESGVVVKAVVQQNEISLLEVLDEFADELMIRGTDLVEDEPQGSTTDQIKEATKFDGNRPQSLLAFVCAETLVKGC
jgi:hypothetical protein